MENFLEHTGIIPKDKGISLLEPVPKNCPFSFQVQFYQQLQGATVGSSVSPIIGKIYMEYFEEIVLGSQCPMPILGWKRYVDDVISIVKKNK